MAVAKADETTKLILKVEAGIGASGQMTYKERGFANFNPILTDEDMFAIGTAIGALSAQNVGSINRQDKAVLVEE